MQSQRILILFFAVVTTLATVNAVAQSVIEDATFTFADVTLKGATEVDSYAVNNAGVIAGDYIDSKSVQHGLILNGTKATVFNGPTGSTAIAAFGINNSNVVVGWYANSSNVPTSFMYAKGKSVAIAYPGAAATEANGINDNGWVVGSYFDSKGNEHGFYWDTKKYTAINVKGAAETVAWAINNKNTITVFTLTSAGASQDSYLLNGTKLTKMDVPKATSTTIHGIDTAGDLDFTTFDSKGNRHGVLYQAKTKTYTQFDDPKGINSTRADGINDSLEMVGRYTNAAGAPAGFKVTTKP